MGVSRRSSEREPADSLRDKSNIIGGWLPSLTFALGASYRNRLRARRERDSMKTLPLLLAMWTWSSSSLFADLLTFRFAGTVAFDQTGGNFTAGRPYALTVTIDTAAGGVLLTPQEKEYHNAIKSFVFDYNSGSYVAQGQNRGYVKIMNDDRGLYDHFILSFGDFPRLPGVSSSGAASLMLTDLTTNVFASLDLPRILPLEAFELRDFEIGWGGNWDQRSVELDLQSITLLNRGPEITAWHFSGNAFTFTIESPNIGDTNVIERAFLLAPLTTWEVIVSFSSSGRTTTVSVPVLTNQPAAFYRVGRQ